MKIQCDVCAKEEASVFCTADEAALCQNCDNRVHNANKLASKHPRFSLLNPQFKESPSCDICQERRALLFCQEDRALLCRECDIPIHRANEHTKKHNRFLLTGVKLSAAASSYEAATSSSGSQSETEIKISVTNEVNCQPNSTANCSESSSSTWRDNEASQPVSQQASDSTSSIAEYLMETLPGWHVEDLLDPSSQYGFCKIHKQMSPHINEEYRGMPDCFIQRHAYAFTSYASLSEDGFDYKPFSTYMYPSKRLLFSLDSTYSLFFILPLSLEKIPVKASACFYAQQIRKDVLQTSGFGK